jgi:hypothetical protein
MMGVEMEDSVEVGSVVKIERTEKGWVATVATANGGHIGQAFKHWPTFDEAVASIKRVVTAE